MMNSVKRRLGDIIRSARVKTKGATFGGRSSRVVSAGASEASLERPRRSVMLGAVFGALVLAVSCFAVPQQALALDLNANPIQVHSVDDMIELIKYSRGMNGPYESFEGKTIALNDDIDFDSTSGGGDKIDQIITEVGSLTFGDKDHPFKGEFDGQGYYIRHLDYHRDLWKPKANTGLFSFTDGAYLHDVHFSDCYIGADYRGGVLVGQAKNTRIESVRMEDCTLSVTPANNSVSLITNAGIMGGLIAGELLDGSSMYNCTAQGGRVVNNSVVAVSGLGGEGLYLGALVGSAEHSQIEYCRVLPSVRYYADRAAADNPESINVYADNYKYLTEVYNRYEVAVGAVAGQSVYAGGVVGYIKDVDVVDCFSTAWVHTWVANYVGVGAGNIGYVGGIAAISRSDDKPGTESNIIRCHYASNMESYQYNALAVIPIIQSNVYLSGLLERDWEEDTNLYNSYFKRGDIVGKDSAIKPYPKGFVRAWGDWLGLNYSGGENGKSAQGFGYGPIVDDAKYADRLFWEGEGYDFEGDEDRASAAINKPHVNKWIMDEYLGIPVHGESVKATLDFPGAGDVSISSSTLGKEQKTADPYNFAVQGVTANETELTFTATVNNDRDKNGPLGMVSSDANEGFRFQGWFRNGDVTVNHTQKGNHKFFDPMVPPEPQGKQVSGDLAHTAYNSGTGDAKDKAFRNNDLFVAYYQAQVLFHGVNGEVLGFNAEADNNTEDDWYNHQDALPVVDEPVVRDNVDAGAKFLGWTTQKNEATNGGWPNVTVSELNSMKTDGKFFEGGEAIERPMDLYPVYASLGMNVIPIAEGHELDSTNSDLNVREGVLKANVTAVDGKYVLSVQGYNADGSLMAEGELPDGYRFLGWYEIEQDREGNPLYTEGPEVVYNAGGSTATVRQYKFGRKLSNDSPVVIPDSVDLTQRHYYYARFEYRVDYYASTTQSNVPGWNDQDNPKFYTERWKTYCSKFDVLNGPQFFDDKIDHWSTKKAKEHAEGDNAEKQLENGIVSHFNVYSHNKKTGQVGNYDIVVTFDFPNSAKINMKGNPWTGAVNDFTIQAVPTDPDGFHFIGWSWIREGSGGTATDNPWETGGHGTSADYAYEAHLVAHATFIDGADSGDLVVNRAYSDCKEDEKLGFVDGFQKVFIDTPSTYKFRYQNYPNADFAEKENNLTVDVAASPTDEYMQSKKPDKLFLGWIDKYEFVTGTMTDVEYGHLYNEIDRTSKVPIEVIRPYLVKKDRLCDRPMVLYPVYADYSCKTATNITRGTALTEPTNPVIDPVLVDVAINDDGTKTVAVNADVKPTTVEKYALTSWSVESPESIVVDTVCATDAEGNPVTTGGIAVSNDNATLKYPIKAGQSYVIVANYETNRDVELNVTYHTNAGATEVVAKHAGDALGKGPAALFEVPNAAFVGWSEQAPDAGEYLTYDVADATKMVDEYTIVERPMELWPVYRVIGTEGDQANVKVNSNIDDAAGTNHRRATVKSAATPQGTQTYVALEADAVDGYKFIGWYKDFEKLEVGADGNVKVTGTPVPGNRVTGEEMFAGNLYTAVYQQTQVYKVVYHFPDVDGADGPLTEGADTIEFAAEDTSAFVQKTTIQKPEVGPDGNPVYNPDGTPQMVEVEVEATVVGGEQTASMEGFLSKKDSQGHVKELFKEWEWKQDGATVAWDAFCKNSIVQSMKDANVTEMHLYPVTHRLNALDQDDAPYEASNLVWQIDPEALTADVTDPDAPDAKPAVKIAFAPRTLYLGNKLTIHMAVVHYAAGVQPTETPMNDKLVALYDNFDFTTAKQLDKKVTGLLTADDPTPGDGNAIFHFDTTGALTIDKTAPIMAAGSTFTFTVTECNEKGEIAKDAKSATVTMTAVDDGQGAATARETISVPWGYYKVVETSWGWRYSPTYRFFEGGMTIEGRPDNVVLVRSQGTAKVTNTLANEEYLDGEDRAKNVFGVGRNSNMGGGAR